MQVLVLTHELSDARSWDLGKYQEHFYPVRPQLLYGRSATLQPTCNVKQAVWYGWRDIVAFAKRSFLDLCLLEASLAD